MKMTDRIRPRPSSTVPFGYVLHPTNSHLIVENLEEQALVREIRELYPAQSLRKIVKYVEAHTGRKLTPRGVKKILTRKY